MQRPSNISQEHTTIAQPTSGHHIQITEINLKKNTVCCNYHYHLILQTSCGIGPSLSPPVEACSVHEATIYDGKAQLDDDLRSKKVSSFQSQGGGAPDSSTTSLSMNTLVWTTKWSSH
jgi:hypothetical protein